MPQRRFSVTGDAHGQRSETTCTINLERPNILRSVEVLSALIKQNPDDFLAKNDLAISLRLTGDFEQSLAVSEDILQIDPSHRPSLLARIDTNIRAQNYSAALVCVEQAMARIPDDAMIHLKRGIVLRHNQRFDESVAVLSELSEQNPDDLAAKHELAISLRMTGNFEKSLSVSEDILELNPSHRPSLFARIDTNLRAQNYAAALTCVEEAMARLPDDATLQLKRGIVLRQNQRFDESAAILSELIERNPDDLAAKHELAILRRMTGDFDRSLAISEEILHINPSHRLSHLARIDTNLRAQRFSAALDCVREAIAHFPDDAILQLKLGIALRQNQHFDESVAVLSALVEQNPLDLSAKHELAISLRMTGDFEKSLAISEEILQINPLHRPSLLYGSHHSENLIIVVGRASSQKPSASIDKILEQLHKNGFSICFFPYNAAKSNSENSAVLSAFLKSISSQSVFIVAHSAGGIISSLSESDPKIMKLVCFGYPFKHPHKDYELERTAHLKTVTKPFLILQGDADSYGTQKQAERYDLSDSIEIVEVTSDHSYNELSESDYKRCLDRISGFLALN